MFSRPPPNMPVQRVLIKMLQFGIIAETKVLLKFNSKNILYRAIVYTYIFTVPESVANAQEDSPKQQAPKSGNSCKLTFMFL